MAAVMWIVGALSAITVSGTVLAIKKRRRRKEDRIECLLGGVEQELNFDILETMKLQTVSVAKIIGSISRCFDFDSNFDLKKHMSDERFLEIKRIMKMNQTLPPVTLYEINQKYYVMDGHHRVSAAKRLRRDEIVANVIGIEIK